MARRLTPQQFLEKVRKLHGDQYDLSEIEYIDAKTPIRVICPLHGPFQTSPGHFSSTKPTGCSKCGRHSTTESRRKTTVQFIASARKVHGDLYDYSKTVYRQNKAKVEIICRSHGVFLQTPSNHLTGFGCPKCGRERTEQSIHLTPKEFFARASVAHKHRYKYPDQTYGGPDSTIRAICSKHGEFLSGARNHLWNKRGCPDCGREASGAARTVPFDEFLKDATRVHKSRYSYDSSSYRGLSDYLRIECSKHGWFKQRGHKHIAGQGCEKCARQRLIGRWKTETMSDDLKNERCSFYYLRLKSSTETIYKVGITNSVERRIRQISLETDYEI